MERRNRWLAAARGLVVAGLLAVSVGGCHLLPVGRVNPALDPRSLGKRESAPVAQEAVAATRTAKPATMATSVTRASTAASVPLPDLPLQPMTDRELLAEAPPTPLLDAALVRTRAIEEATFSPVRDGSELVEAAAREAREAAGPMRESSFDPAPTALPAGASEPGPELVLVPPPQTGAVIEPLMGLATATGPAGPASTGNEVEAAAEVTESSSTNEKAQAAPDSESEWTLGLSRLRELAKRESECGEDTTWDLRAGLLSWLAGENPTGAAGNLGEREHPLRSVAFQLLSEVSEADLEKGVDPVEPAADLELRAAAWAIESRLPLRITALELCRKVRSFGNYDVADSRQVEAGQTVTLYCELEGVAFEGAEGGYRSRLSTTLEIRKAGEEAVAWSLDLGRVEDECRRRRRDYYVNYRVALPGAQTLPPGEYELALTQRDEVSGREVRRELPIGVVAAQRTVGE